MASFIVPNNWLQKNIPVVCLLSIIFALLGLLHSQSSDGAGTETVNTERFIKLFRYELQNRAFAYGAIKHVVAKPDKVKNIGFWEAYFALENYNKTCFGPVAKSYHLSTEPGRLTQIRASMSAWLVRVSETYSIGIIHNATKKYVSQLEELKQLATDDHDFFEYVVEQEKIQLEAMRLVLGGEPEEAEKLIHDFIGEQDAKKAKNTGGCSSVT